MAQKLRVYVMESGAMSRQALLLENGTLHALYNWACNRWRIPGTKNSSPTGQDKENRKWPNQQLSFRSSTTHLP